MKTAFQLLGVLSAAVSSPSEFVMPRGAFLSAATKCGCLQAGGYVLSLVQMGTPGAWVALRCGVRAASRGWAASKVSLPGRRASAPEPRINP